MITQNIANAIEGYINGNYRIWTIGITDNPDRRWGEHSNPQSWHCWNTYLETTARQIEKYFVNKGCKGDTGGGYSPTYVYIF